MSGGDWKDLYKGIENGDLNLVEFHTQNGVDLNYQHPEILMLPLVTALKLGHIDIALYLYENGADPWLESYYDRMNAVEAAYFYRRLRMIEQFNSNGIRLNLPVKLKLKLRKIPFLDF